LHADFVAGVAEADEVGVLFAAVASVHYEVPVRCRATLTDQAATDGPIARSACLDTELTDEFHLRDIVHRYGDLGQNKGNIQHYPLTIILVDATSPVCHALLALLGLGTSTTRSTGAMHVVFHKDGNDAAFLEMLREAQEVAAMRLPGYCLMPNHFHLVLWPQVKCPFLLRFS